MSPHLWLGKLGDRVGVLLPKEGLAGRVRFMGRGVQI